jgi:hypothetical protein
VATLAAIYDSFERENTGLLFQQVKRIPHVLQAFFLRTLLQRGDVPLAKN